MNAAYYDPLFYLCSDEMPFTIRIETTFKDEVDPRLLTAAVTKALRRYPYFSIRIVREGGEWLTVPNDLPPVVYPGPEVRDLGSEGVNRHLFALSYEEKKVNFFISHVITDGAGLNPFLKSTFYYYLTARYGVTLDVPDVRLADDPLLPGETDAPYPEERMKNAVLFSRAIDRPFFRLTEGGRVRDERRIVYRVRFREADVFRVNRSADGSPSSLFSSIMYRVIRRLHPDEPRDIVSAVSFNMRPALGCRNTYRMLCSAIRVFFPERLKNADIGTLCTCARGIVSLQSEPSNVLCAMENRRKMLSTLETLPEIADKKAFLAPLALKDATDNTFSVSFVGRLGYGDMEKYIESIYNITDGSTYRTLFMEISSVNGWFDVAFLQGFSSDVYYRGFLEEAEALGIAFVEDGTMEFDTPGIELP